MVVIAELMKSKTSGDNSEFFDLMHRRVPQQAT